VLLRHALQQVRRDEALDELGERPGVHQARRGRAELEHVRGRNGGVGILESPVVGRTREGERGDEGAGADAGHHAEAGPRTGLLPAAEEARRIGAVLAAAGEHEPRLLVGLRGRGEGVAVLLHRVGGEARIADRAGLGLEAFLQGEGGALSGALVLGDRARESRGGGR
jgi:hypothetical protein